MGGVTWRSSPAFSGSVAGADLRIVAPNAVKEVVSDAAARYAVGNRTVLTWVLRAIAGAWRRRSVRCGANTPQNLDTLKAADRADAVVANHRGGRRRGATARTYRTRRRCASPAVEVDRHLIGPVVVIWPNCFSGWALLIGSSKIRQPLRALRLPSCSRAARSNSVFQQI